MIFQVIRTSMYADESEKPYEKYVPIQIDINGDKREVWGIEIKSLEELMKFYKAVGEIIITTSRKNNKTPMIEIYDGHRE